MTIGLDSPVFIVGAGRSGTTLLRTSLAAHPRIAVTPETHFMKFADRFGAATQNGPDDFDAFWKKLTGWVRFRDLDVAPEDVRSLIEAAGDTHFRTIFAAMLTAYRDKASAARIGEKTPGHYRYLARLLDWFPNARIIAVRRDPRAIVASALRAPWVTRQISPARLRDPYVRRLRFYHVAAQSAGWTLIYEHVIPQYLADPRVHLLAYEDLVAQPEDELRALCGFLDEPFDTAMLTERDKVAGAGASRTMPDDAQWTAWVAQHETRTGGAITSAGLERWRETLGRRECGAIEEICAAGMRRYGYETTTAPAGRRLPAMIGRALIGAMRTEERARQALAGIIG